MVNCGFCQKAITTTGFCCDRAELEALRKERVKHVSLKRAVDDAIRALAPVASVVVLDDGGTARETAALTLNQLAAARKAAA